LLLSQVASSAEYLTQSVADEALMLAYAKGQASAFDFLYQRHKQVVYLFFVKQGLPIAIAEELCHDTWLKLINAREKYQPQALFKTYLFTIARNTLIDHYKKKSTQNEDNNLNDDNELTATSATPQLCKQQQAQQLQLALSRSIAALPVTQREVFLLKQESGFSLEQIAQITAQHQEKVKSSWRYALQRLRKGLQNYVN